MMAVEEFNTSISTSLKLSSYSFATPVRTEVYVLYTKGQ